MRFARSLVRSALLLCVVAPLTRAQPVGRGRRLDRDSIRVFPLTPVTESLSCGLRWPGRLVVRDTATWRWLWTQTQRCHMEPSDLPPIDFEREMVIVAALGQRPHTGFGIAIDSAVLRGDELRIVITRLRQACDCPFVGQAVTSPIAMQRTPALPGLAGVTFEDRSDRATRCVAGPRASSPAGRAIIQRACQGGDR